MMTCVLDNAIGGLRPGNALPTLAGALFATSVQAHLPVFNPVKAASSIYLVARGGRPSPSQAGSHVAKPIANIPNILSL